MAYDEALARRIRTEFGGIPFEEKRMFGGVGFLMHGNMTCGVHQSNLIVRVNPDKYEALLDKPHTRVFDITGRPMKGWLIIEPEGCRSENQLREWVREGIEFAGSLPPKIK